MKANETKPTPLQYAATTSEAGYRRLEAALALMGNLRNTLIRHRNAARGSHRLTFTFKLQNAHHTSQRCSSCEHVDAGINAAENIQRQGLLVLTKRHGKDAAPNPHRPAIRGTNPRYRACLLRSAYDSAHTTQNGLRGKI